jgi:hypothetical protein
MRKRVERSGHLRLCCFWGWSETTREKVVVQNEIKVEMLPFMYGTSLRRLLILFRHDVMAP